MSKLKKIIEEEIEDLKYYIDGIPDELLSGSYGKIYKDRLEKLKEELEKIGDTNV